MAKKRIAAIVTTVSILLVVFVTLMAILLPRPRFQSGFKSRCEKFPESSQKCQTLWDTFEKAYEKKSPYNFPDELYDPVLDQAPFTHPGGKTLLWHRTKGVAHDFTKNKSGRDCLTTLEDTLLGSVLDEQHWCGLEGCSGTYTTFCKWFNKNNTVNAFWRRASMKFAQHAEGNVTVMLNGNIDNPYEPDSILASIEIPNLTSPRVTGLNVILVTAKGTCENTSLGELQRRVEAQKIAYSCKEVTRSHVESCAKDTSCLDCLSRPESG